MSKKRTWMLEGRCPDCGELGPLDAFGGARCSEHGAYPLILEKDIPAETAKNTNNFPYLPKLPGFDACWEVWAEYKNLTIPVVAENTKLVDVLTYRIPLPISTLSDGFTLFERLGSEVVVLGMQITVFNELKRKYADLLSLETDPLRQQKGFVATIWGAQIIAHPEIPLGYVYLMSQENSGNLPELAVQLKVA